MSLQSKAKPKINEQSSHNEEDDLFANPISADEFMRQIKTIQQSNDKQDVDLRNAAKNYMNNLHCV